jgi:D-lactate dehydrogenase (cytochrome)
LGIITELHLALQPKPETVWGVVCFLDTPEQVITLTGMLRDQGLPATRIAALEYFDANALDLLRHDMADGTLMGLPLLSDEWREALYIEIYASSIKDIAQAGEALIEKISAVGGSGDATWVAAEEGALLQLKNFRHAVPERVNAHIAQRRQHHPGLTKLGTDFAVPDNHFNELMSIYRTDLAKANFEYVIFGHIGDNHVHVNILPRNMSEYNYGRQLYLRWAERVVKWGGSVSAEHGIGKLKRALLQIMYGERGLTGMMHLKKVFDPQFRLNSGNLFNPS